MTFSNINVSNPNDGLGSKLRDAFIIVNDNFSLIGDMVTPEQLSATLSNYATKVYVDSEDTNLQNQINNLSDLIDLGEGNIQALQTDLNNLELLVDGKASIGQLNDSVAAINSTIAALQIVVDSKLSDAPKDGLTYGRKDAHWVVVGGGSSVNKVVGTLYQRSDNTVEQINEGTLEIGRTYWIKTLQPGDDFSNCGDNQNTEDRRFIATATTPTNWTNGSSIQWQVGAPVINILENTLKQPFYFEYLDKGEYWIQSYDTLFTVDKTFCLLTDMFDKGSDNQIDVRIEYWDNTTMKLLTDTNDVLNGHCIEIRVYN